MDTLTINGKTYRVRYYYRNEKGFMMAVLDTNGLTVPELHGEFGDEFPA
jgi:hypothetical protein